MSTETSVATRVPLSALCHVIRRCFLAYFALPSDLQRISSPDCPKLTPQFVPLSTRYLNLAPALVTVSLPTFVVALYVNLVSLP